MGWRGRANEPGGADSRGAVSPAASQPRASLNITMLGCRSMRWHTISRATFSSIWAPRWAWACARERGGGAPTPPARRRPPRRPAGPPRRRACGAGPPPGLAGAGRTPSPRSMYFTAHSCPVASSRSRRARPKLPEPRSFIWRGEGGASEREGRKGRAPHGRAGGRPRLLEPRVRDNLQHHGGTAGGRSRQGWLGNERVSSSPRSTGRSFFSVAGVGRRRTDERLLSSQQRRHVACATMRLTPPGPVPKEPSPRLELLGVCHHDAARPAAAPAPRGREARRGELSAVVG